MENINYYYFGYLCFPSERQRLLFRLFRREIAPNKKKLTCQILCEASVKEQIERKRKTIEIKHIGAVTDFELQMKMIFVCARLESS